jgi:hypothetical protein
MNAEILEKRRKVLGASETATILGYGKYAGSTPDAVYWRKVSPPPEDVPNDAQMMGNDFEPALVQWAQRQLGVSFDTDPSVCFQIMLEGIGKGILAATPDGILLNSKRRWGLEGKAVMWGNPGIDQWGEPDTDKVPDDVIIQTQQQEAVWNLDIVFIPVLWCVGFRPEWRMYHTKRDPEFFGKCVAPPAVEWWNDHVLAQIPPGDEPPPLEVIKRLERKQGLYVPADAETVAMIKTWDILKQTKNDSENEAEEMLRGILSRLGEAEGFSLPDGRLFKYPEQNGSRRCDLDVLQQKYPEAYQETVTQPKHRTAWLVGKAKTVAV